MIDIRLGLAVPTIGSAPTRGASMPTPDMLAHLDEIAQRWRPMRQVACRNPAKQPE
jgi:hypothetical protein